MECRVITGCTRGGLLLPLQTGLGAVQHRIRYTHAHKRRTSYTHLLYVGIQCSVNGGRNFLSGFYPKSGFFKERDVNVTISVYIYKDLCRFRFLAAGPIGTQRPVLDDTRRSYVRGAKRKTTRGSGVRVFFFYYFGAAFAHTTAGQKCRGRRETDVVSRQ